MVPTIEARPLFLLIDPVLQLENKAMHPLNSSLQRINVFL